MQFQFHSGPIKRIPGLRHNELMPDFNSIVVRLKAWGSRLMATFKEKFQFHSGPIKSRNIDVECIKDADFNSIVVRLKA